VQSVYLFCEEGISGITDIFCSQKEDLALSRFYLEERHALANTLPGHFTTLHLVMLAF